MDYEREIVSRVEEYIPDVPAPLFSFGSMSKPKLRMSLQRKGNR